MIRRTITVLLVAFSAHLITGCATLHTEATIPTGTWSGQGVFVASGPSPDAKGDTINRPWIREHGAYPTELTITAREVDGTDGYEIEILSMRGQTTHLEGDRTHIRARLARADTLRDGLIRTYRITDFGVAFHEEPPDLDQGPHGAAHASCMLDNGALVLRLHYLKGFVDTLRFRGRGLTKDGSYSGNEGDGFIHWTEHLQQR